MENEILIIGREEIIESGDERGISELVETICSSKIKVKDLKKEFQSSISNISELFSDLEEYIKQFSLDEITISLEISAEGKIAILGSGVSGSLNSGIQLKFVKKE